MGKYGRVNPETVGQATGIRDKHIKDIFEGDILKVNHKTALPVGLAVVKYDKEWSAFRAFAVDRPGMPVGSPAWTKLWATFTTTRTF